MEMDKGIPITSISLPAVGMQMMAKKTLQRTMWFRNLYFCNYWLDELVLCLSLAEKPDRKLIKQVLDMRWEWRRFVPNVWQSFTQSSAEAIGKVRFLVLR